ncbi:hypothetical protein CapIbe_013614 [Capra ibex]
MISFSGEPCLIHNVYILRKRPTPPWTPDEAASGPSSQRFENEAAPLRLQEQQTVWNHGAPEVDTVQTFRGWT